MNSLNNAGIRRWSRRLLTASFLLGTFVPGALIAWKTDQDVGIEQAEKRHAASCPAAPRNWTSLVTFASRFEAYFNDHFGFRARLVSWNNHVRLHYLKSPV